MGWNYGYRGGYEYGYAPYVPVAQRRAQAARELAKLLKRGEKATPIQISGRTIATTFWGKAWCTNLEGYSDFSNRLPRGRRYACNGSIVHLEVTAGKIKAFVSGSELYEIEIRIAALAKSDWLSVKKNCAGQIGSLVELLQGKLSTEVMQRVSDRQSGLFPRPKDIQLKCSCPDYAGMCKHLAAVMYGVGHRLDSAPELLFLLRGVDHLELIEQAIPAAPKKSRRATPAIATEDLGSIFGIEISAADTSEQAAAPRRRRASQGQAPATPPAVKKPAARRRTPAAKPKRPAASKPAARQKATAARPAPAARKAKSARTGKKR